MLCVSISSNDFILYICEEVDVLEPYTVNNNSFVKLIQLLN